MLPKMRSKMEKELTGKPVTPYEYWSGRGAAWLAHLLWEQGVGGSNPLAPTSIHEGLQVFL